MENFALFNLLKMLGGMNAPKSEPLRENPSAENPANQAERQNTEQPLPAHNVMADVIERHERHANRIKNKK